MASDGFIRQWFLSHGPRRKGYAERFVSHEPWRLDSLRYEYFSNSNLLRKVTDLVADQTPGHFKDTSITADDYAYDVGGNIVKDNNRRMHQTGGGNGAVYNILDKPDSIVIADKSTTRYEYDAAGNLLRKKISGQEGGQTVQKEYVYIAGFVYLNDTLQYSLMEEGCVRRVMRRSFQTGEMYEAFDYQYYVKDRQGNIRTVLTEGRRQGHVVLPGDYGTVQ